MKLNIQNTQVDNFQTSMNCLLSSLSIDLTNVLKDLINIHRDIALFYSYEVCLPLYEKFKNNSISKIELNQLGYGILNLLIFLGYSGANAISKINKKFKLSNIYPSMPGLPMVWFYLNYFRSDFVGNSGQIVLANLCGISELNSLYTMLKYLDSSLIDELKYTNLKVRVEDLLEMLNLLNSDYEYYSSGEGKNDLSQKYFYPQETINIILNDFYVSGGSKIVPINEYYLKAEGLLNEKGFYYSIDKFVSNLNNIVLTKTPQNKQSKPPKLPKTKKLSSSSGIHENQISLALDSLSNIKNINEITWFCESTSKILEFADSNVFINEKIFEDERLSLSEKDLLKKVLILIFNGYSLEQITKLTGIDELKFLSYFGIIKLPYFVLNVVFAYDISINLYDHGITRVDFNVHALRQLLNKNYDSDQICKILSITKGRLKSLIKVLNTGAANIRKENPQKTKSLNIQTRLSPEQRLFEQMYLSDQHILYNPTNINKDKLKDTICPEKVVLRFCGLEDEQFVMQSVDFNDFLWRVNRLKTIYYNNSTKKGRELVDDILFCYQNPVYFFEKFESLGYGLYEKIKFFLKMKYGIEQLNMISKKLLTEVKQPNKVISTKRVAVSNYVTYELFQLYLKKFDSLSKCIDFCRRNPKLNKDDQLFETRELIRTFEILYELAQSGYGLNHEEVANCIELLPLNIQSLIKKIYNIDYRYFMLIRISKQKGVYKKRQQQYQKETKIDQSNSGLENLLDDEF